MGTQGTLVFGPLTSSAGWSLTLSAGVSPSACAVTFPAAAIAELESPVHTLTLEQDGNRIVLPDAHIVRTQSQSLSGNLVKCTIQDRRWRWQHAYIDGSYNIPQEDGTYLREKTPQELATLLFESMGEVGFVVDALPNDARPQVNWQSTRADSELVRLCSPLGCFPTLDYLTGQAKLYRTGEGEFSPGDGRIIRRAKVISATPKPKTIRVVFGPTFFETNLLLEAVGFEPDGELKVIEELSYLAALGETAGVPNWKNISPGTGAYWGGIQGTYESNGQTLLLADLAESCVYRLYRVAGQNEEFAFGRPKGNWYIELPREITEGRANQPEKLEDILPIRSTRLTKYKNDSGQEVESPAVVYGKFNPIYSLDWAVPPLIEGIYPGDFSIRNSQGIVEFQDPVFLSDLDDNNFGPAELNLITSYPVNNDGVFIRWEEFFNNENEDSFGSFRVSVPDTQMRLAKGLGIVESSNEEQIREEGQHYLTALAKKYESQTGYEVHYSRIVPITLDGVVRQVTWSGGGGRPATTTVSANMEHSPNIAKYERQEAAIIEAGEKADRRDGLILGDLLL